MTERCPTCSRSEAYADGCGDVWHTQFAVNTSGPGEHTRLQRWVDPAMYAAEPISGAGPSVTLLWATPDPLGVIAAVCGMYEGRVVRSLTEVTREQRERYLGEMLKTTLQAPLEFVRFHFLLEGVTRSFTHQLVRQRTATYAQESLRFAVKEDLPVGLPPSLAGTEGGFDHFTETANRDWGRLSREERWRNQWDAAVAQAHRTYTTLVNAGMPAEDARGLLPHNVLTRVHYTTDLRGLLHHAGMRLCTQAQFEWRAVFSQLATAIRQYNDLTARAESSRDGEVSATLGFVGANDAWQWEALAGLFKPICYATGKCEFNSAMDRACSIRNRVEANHALGRPSSQWSTELDEVSGHPIVAGVGPHSVVRDEDDRPVFIGAIHPGEWLANPEAAR